MEGSRNLPERQCALGDIVGGRDAVVGRKWWTGSDGQEVVDRKWSLSYLFLPPLQEHPECVPGTGSHPGAESRAAAQVCHAGHRHHAQAGKATPQWALRPRILSSALWHVVHLGTGSLQPQIPCSVSAVHIYPPPPRLPASPCALSSTGPRPDSSFPSRVPEWRFWPKTFESRTQCLKAHHGEWTPTLSSPHPLPRKAKACLA